MSNREKYSPGAAAGAEVRKEGDKWTLDAMKLEGWQRLHAEYAAQFGIEAPEAVRGARGRT